MWNLALCALLQISGEVLDPAGQPAAGATVKLWRWDGETVPKVMRPWLALRHQELASIATAADGRFRLPVKDGRLYAVTAERGDEHAVLVDRVGSGRMLVLRLLLPVQVRGRVVRHVKGEKVPVEGAEVTATVEDNYDWDRADTPWPPPATLQRVVRTDRQGSFRVDVPATGPIELVASATEGESTLRARAGVAKEPVELLLEPAPAPRPTGSVQLLDATTGKPVAGARCMIFHGRELTSDAEGMIRHTPWHGMPLIPKAHCRTAVDLAAGATQVVRLQPGLGVKGRLVRADGRPMANARTVWASTITLTTFGGGHGFGWPWFDTTDGEGRFELGCMAPGWDLAGFVELDGAFVPFVHRVVKDALDLGDVPVRSDGRLPGRVLGPDGAPVADATVLLERVPDVIEGQAPPESAIASRSGATDRKGAFLFADLVPGTYRIVAWSAQLAPAIVTHAVTAGSEPATVRLQTGATLTGVVLAADGSPARGVTVLARIEQGPRELEPFFDRAECRTDQEGRFVLSGLPKDSDLNLDAHGTVGGAWQSAPSQTVRSDAAELELRLRKR